MIKLRVVSRNFSPADMDPLFNTKAEGSYFENPSQSTRLILDPIVTTSVVALMTASIPILAEKIIEHILIKRRQQNQDQLRRETIHIKVRTEVGVSQIEMTKEFPDNESVQPALKDWLSQLDELYQAENASIEIIVQNDLE